MRTLFRRLAALESSGASAPSYGDYYAALQQHYRDCEQWARAFIRGEAGALPRHPGYDYPQFSGPLDEPDRQRNAWISFANELAWIQCGMPPEHTLLANTPTACEKQIATMINAIRNTKEYLQSIESQNTQTEIET
jgi:hypothetical protein